MTYHLLGNDNDNLRLRAHYSSECPKAMFISPVHPTNAFLIQSSARTKDFATDLCTGSAAALQKRSYFYAL